MHEIDIHRIREGQDDYRRFFCGCMNAAIILSLVYVPILCWYFATRKR